MGGPDIQAPTPPPTPPSAQQQSAGAIQAQISALPEILKAQYEFGPQFSQAQLEALQTFGPQFAQEALELQREFAPQFAEVERQVSPELAAASDTLRDFLAQTDEEEFQRLMPGLVENVRAGQSIRGIGDVSPLGAIDEAVQVQQLQESLRNRRMNVALSTAGRTPVSAFPTVQGQTGVGQLVQNVAPQSIFGAQAGINTLNQRLFETQANMFLNQPPSILGQITGGLAGAAAGAAGTAIGGPIGGAIGTRLASYFG